MYLKKLIGAFTALIMTVTVFAGSAVTVSAYSETQTSSYVLTFKLADNESEEWIVYATDITEFLSYAQTNAMIKYKDNSYVVQSVNFTGLGLNEASATLTVKQAPTIDVKIEGTGTVTINGTKYKNGDKYVASAGTSIGIGIESSEGFYIESVTLGSKSYDIPSNSMSRPITHTMKDEVITLEVTFVGAYDIAIADDILNGSVSTSRTTAKAGDEVTVYPIPSEGYRIASLTYTTENGSEPVDINNQSGSYTFKMPDAAVTINATFEKIPVYPSTEATHKDDYNDPNKGDSASLWEGTLVGQGTAYCPKVTVTLNGGKSQEAIGQTTVAGDSSVTIAVVVDKVKNDIKSVMLEGVGNPDSSGFEIKTDDPTNSETGEVD